MALKLFLFKQSLDIGLALGDLLVGFLAGVQESVAASGEVWQKRLFTLLFVVAVALYFGYR